MLSPQLLSLILTFAICVTIAAPGYAIEKHKKDADSSKVDTTATTAPAQPQQKQALPKDTAKVIPKIKRFPAFNDFIDVNRNGVDDRLEQGSNLLPPKKIATPTPTPQKADTTKSIPAAPKADAAKKKDK